MSTKSLVSRKTWIVLGIVFFVVALLAFILAPAEHSATGIQSRSFKLDVDYDKVRQIMVRKNGVESMIANSGMKLLEQSIQDVQLDTSRDDRPIINAILGKSKSDLSAIKHLTVQLDDPFLEADVLLLRQAADVGPEEIKVVTESREPSGRLEKYRTTLHALPKEGSTEISVSVEMNILVRVPKIFRWRADQRVQQAANRALENQQKAMTKFIKEHSDQRLILPDFAP